MPKIIEPKVLQGFRDFLPEQLRVRQKAIAILRSVFEKYGFEPLETPTLEYQETLLGKYGEEAEKLMYLFEDNGKRAVGMRYDVTVPTARVIAQYPSIPKPFKRYQIQQVWRSDKPQKGRYREFTQCDFDTFGITAPLADAEIIAVMAEALQALGFKSFKIKINSRPVLFKMMEQAGVEPDRYLQAIQSIDKLDKKTQSEVEVDLADKGFKKEVIKNIFDQLKVAEPNDNLREILALLPKLGVSEDNYVFDPSLARGLDYYTGVIYEAVVTEPKIGSIIGGGRYDKLIGTFTSQDVPAVGTSMGLDRIVDVITELKLWPESKMATTKALVTIFSPQLLDESLKLESLLKKQDISVEIYLDPNAKLEKQLKYADQKGIPYVVIIGPDEAEKGLVTVKNLQSKTQVTVPAENIVDEIK